MHGDWSCRGRLRRRRKRDPGDATKDKRKKLDWLNCCWPHQTSFKDGKRALSHTNRRSVKRLGAEPWAFRVPLGRLFIGVCERKDSRLGEVGAADLQSDW